MRFAAKDAKGGELSLWKKRLRDLTHTEVDMHHASEVDTHRAGRQSGIDSATPLISPLRSFPQPSAHSGLPFAHVGVRFEGLFGPCLRPLSPGPASLPGGSGAGPGLSVLQVLRCLGCGSRQSRLAPRL